LYDTRQNPETLKILTFRQQATVAANGNYFSRYQKNQIKKTNVPVTEKLAIALVGCTTRCNSGL
jgi:hypothetical protein